MKKFLPVILLSLFVLPLVAFAAPVDPTYALCNLFQKVKVILAAVGFVLAAILLIVGGIKYMTSSGDDEKAGSARKLIINALIGITIIIAAVFLVNLVEGFLGNGVILNPIANPCVVM
jgi:hypothetical protein